jgi:putative ubiquitin-RnfH superfamily antitoxin RatB of RatAB toxin-antitoxin module
MARYEDRAPDVRVSLVYSAAPRQVREWTLELSSGSRVAQALERCSLFEEFPELASGPMVLGIWGKRTGLNHLLRENDRVEIYRGLRVDPKVARRERFDRQGVKRAGLFSGTRAGAKAGY